MIAFPSMLVEAAKRAGMKVPEDCENYDPMAFPHWHVFLTAQIGAPMPYMGIHWENAKVVAAIPDDQIMEVSYEQLADLGFGIGYSYA